MVVVSVLLVLPFLFRSDSATTVATVHQSHKPKNVFLVSSAIRATQDSLRSVEFFLRAHRRMFPLVPAAASLGIFKEAIEKRILKHCIYRGTGHRLLRSFVRFTGSEAPFVCRNVADFL